MVRFAVFRLRRLEAQPVLGFRQRPLDAHGGTIQIDIREPQSKQLSPAHASGQINHGDLVERVARSHQQCLQSERTFALDP
jgi:hypothetical protein